MTVGESLKRFRKERGLTQKQVSDAVGINLRLYQGYESGQTNPATSTVIGIADAFNVPLDYLVGRNEEIQNTGESYLLNTYRNLDENSRRTLTDMANFLSMRQNFTQSAAMWKGHVCA